MRLFFCVLMLVVCMNASSQPPEQIDKENTGGTQKQAASKKHGTKDEPIFVEILATEEDRVKTADEKTNREATLATNQEIAKFTGEVSGYTLALVCLGVLQAGIILFQVVLMSRQNKANKTIERAYVKMSHYSPGLNDISGTFWLYIEVKNHGNTPANVTDILIKPIILPNNEFLPTVPDYVRFRDEDTPKAFLVANDEFSFSELFKVPEQMPDIESGKLRLYLIGYVDYSDKFGDRHRAGYARMYKPEIDNRKGYSSDEAYSKRNNLIFVTQDGYNYDRECK
ncbi:MAG TPA: hypothetical protein VJ437_02595 [Acidiferrobacterales bacterium]|nr:hypothetical protein [Acidiferrobacterales bacterium]